MKIQIVTSCTGEKRHKPKNQLVQADFRLHGTEAFATREEELAAYRLPARAMYTGQQHVRLIRGLDLMRKSCPGTTIDLEIVSAGYGIINEQTLIAPYEMTFQHMRARELREWADFLQLPKKILSKFSDYDLTFVLLGEEYLKALAFPETLDHNGVLVFLTSKGGLRYLPSGFNILPITLDKSDARRLGAGLVALKGRVIEILGEHVREHGSTVLYELCEKPEGLVEIIKNYKKPRHPAPSTLVDVSQVIQIPKSWWNKSHRQMMMYFIPEWDDLVDPLYDFETDTHPPGSGDSYESAIYAHQIYDEPHYDGILVSKIVVESGKNKKNILEKLGVHRYLRVPREFPIMGDCGAFGYLTEQFPPYETEEILDYYQNLDFDFGVSIDHLIVSGVLKRTVHYLVNQDGERHEISPEEYQRSKDSGEAREVRTLDKQLNFLDRRPVLWKKEIVDDRERWRRYELTINNARDFLEKHRNGGYRFTPIGAAQGWGPESYAEAVRDYQKMGYTYIGLGGLVRTNTPGIMEVLDAISRILKSGTKLHLFGTARPHALVDMQRLGVASIDSASFLRRAWLGASSNYFTPNGSYAAIRIPQADKSPRAKKIVREGKATLDEIKGMEEKCLRLLRDYDRDAADIDTVLDAIMAYDNLMGENRKGFRELFRKTLEDRPWGSCPCKICKEVGIEVMIFRGNNRNRRRGFHNTKVFYDQFCSTFGGDKWISTS